MKHKPILIVTALIIMTIAGFKAGRISSAPQANFSDGEKPIERNMRPTRNYTDALKTSARATRQSSASKSSTDRLARLESIVRGENSYERTRELLAFVDRIAPDDFQSVIDHFRNLGITEGRLGEYGLILSAWAKLDPYAALTYAKANTESPFATRTILASWATQDPYAAIRWAQENHQGDGVNPLLVGVIQGLASSDTVQATNLLKSMPRSNERGEALDALLPHLLAKGNEATRAWIAEISDDSLRNGAISRATEALAKTDPAGTVAWLLENPGEALDRSLDNVFGIWASQDETAARNALATLSEGKMRSDALRGIVSNLALSDPPKAIDLMNSYPADVNDRTLRNFIWHSFGRDPAAALGQVARISDEGRRNEIYRRSMSSWIERDPAAASLWLQENPLPESVTRALPKVEVR